MNCTNISKTNLIVANNVDVALQVEVNLLTGQTTILQTDIIYDCGQSLNPAVDLGQVGPNLIFFVTSI